MITNNTHFKTLTMNNTSSFQVAIIVILIALCITLNAAPLSTQFTYQGELKIIPDGNDIIVPANAEFDFTFELYDALNRGVQVGPTVSIDHVVVDQGIFTVQLDFGLSPFAGDQLYLAIAVRESDNSGNFTQLLPRQTLTAAPYALHAEYVAMGTVGSLEVDSTEVQLRVVGVCTSGTAMSAINQDGTVACEQDTDQQQLAFTGTTLSITNGDAVDLASIDTDDQTLSLNDATLGISGGNAVDASSIVNDDNNELNTGLTLTDSTLNITDAGGTLSSDLAGIDTDDQTLILNNNALGISEGNTVDLSAFTNDDDNELNSDLTLTDTTLNITDAGGTLSTDLSSVDTDDQTLSLNTNQLSISEGNSVDLSSYVNDNDNELNTTVALVGNNLNISDAGGTLSTDLSSLDTDDQTLSIVADQLTVSDGNSVDLSSYVNNDNNELNTNIRFNDGVIEVTDAGGTLSADLSSINTDNQNLGLDSTQLTISNGTGVDLSGFSNNDNDELNANVALNNTTLDITDAGGTLSADLSSINTDNQNLALNNNQLNISGGTGVDLSGFSNNDANELNTDVMLNGSALEITDAGGTLSAELSGLNTDNQNLGLNNTQLSISGGTGVDLSGFSNNDNNELNTTVAMMGSTLNITDAGGILSADLSGVDTDDQTLSLNTNQLSISGGNSVNVSVYANNDSNELQDLSINNNNLQLSGSASSVDLSSYLDNTDAQTLSLVDDDLSISGGNAISLAGLFNDNDVTNELNTGLTFNNDTLTLSDAGGNRAVDLSSASGTAAEVLAKLVTVDGAGTGLDVDLLDGLNANELIAAATPDDNRTPISSIPFTINQSGSYYMADNLTSAPGSSSDGIIIDADNVTLDLGGFTLSGFDRTDPNNPVQSGGEGIWVRGVQFNIRIFNGHVDGWAGDGIEALNCDNCIFERLTASNNGQDGLVSDVNSIISHVTANFNGLDGIEGDDGSVIVFSTARGNGDNGIQTSEGSLVAHSSGFDNEADGIDVAAGSVVTDSVASDNTLYGFDIGLGGNVQKSAAYDNMSNGFDVFSASIIKDNISSLNGGNTTNSDAQETQWNGIRTFANAWVINNKVHENDGAGIRISSQDCVVEGNSFTDNDNGGLVVTSAGNLIINNKAAGNFITDDPSTGATRDPSYEIVTGNAFGPIVDLSTGSVGDLSSVTNADHPFANFVY